MNKKGETNWGFVFLVLVVAVVSLNTYMKRGLDAPNKGGYCDGAIEFEQKLLAGEPVDPVLWKSDLRGYEYLGRCFRQNKERQDDALIYYQKALAADIPKESWEGENQTTLQNVHYGMCDIYLEKGENKKAIAACEKSLKAYPKQNVYTYTTYSFLGQAAAKDGQKKLALKYHDLLKKASEMTPPDEYSAPREMAAEIKAFLDGN